MKSVFLYGISGARDSYRVVIFEEIKPERFSTGYAGYRTRLMRAKNPSVERVFMVSQRYKLKDDFWEAFNKNSVESWVIFKDILETEGIEIIIH